MGRDSSSTEEGAKAKYLEAESELCECEETAQRGSNGRCGCESSASAGYPTVAGDAVVNNRPSRKNGIH
jgi:hypothetical protein